MKFVYPSTLYLPPSLTLSAFFNLYLPTSLIFVVLCLNPSPIVYNGPEHSKSWQNSRLFTHFWRKKNKKSTWDLNNLIDSWVLYRAFMTTNSRVKFLNSFTTLG